MTKYQRDKIILLQFIFLLLGVVGSLGQHAKDLKGAIKSRRGSAEGLRHARNTVLITGGCGFVGRHFTRRYCDMGWHVIVVDNMISESSMMPMDWPRHLHPGHCKFDFHKMDCRHFFLSPMSKRRFDVFIHLAAVVGGRSVIEGSPLSVADDLAIDAGAFTWAVNPMHQPGLMIYFSSSAAYPTKLQSVGSNTFLTEDMINLDDPNIDIAKPDLTYGWAKLTGEYLAKLAREHYDLNVSIYRPMSGYGEDQHEAYPFKSLLNKAIKGNNPIEIWSDATRDFMHVEDIVTCVLKTASKIGNGNPVNLGTGISTNFSTLARVMSNVMGYTADVKVLSGKPKGVNYRVGNATHMKSLGCVANISLKDGVERAVAFMNSTTAHPYTPTGQNNPKEIDSVAGKDKLQQKQFSQHQCTGGSQSFKFHLQKTATKFPVANETEFKVCILKNVCLENQKIKYYLDPWVAQNTPDYLHRGILMKDLANLGYLSPPKYATWAPEVVIGPVPTNINFDTTEVTLFGRLSISDNYGHLLNDEIFPGLIASEMFGYSIADAQLMFYESCDNGFLAKGGEGGGPSFWNSSITRNDLCHLNIQRWYPLFFDNPILWFPNLQGSSRCFRNLIVGHNSAFSLKSLELARGVFLRQARDRVKRRLRLDATELTRHSILVLRKRGGCGPSTVKSNICEQVQAITTNSTVDVECIDPSLFSVEEQIKKVWMSSVIVSEHGTTSYIGLFARDETVLIAVGTDTLLKEPQILLYATHIVTLYISDRHLEDLPGTIHFALRRNMKIFRSQ